MSKLRNFRVVCCTVEDTKFYFSDEYSYHLQSKSREGQLCSKVAEQLIHELKHCPTNLRMQLSIKSVPFLVGLFPDEKEVRFYSPRLSQELFILNHQANHQYFGADLENYKDHVAKVARLSPDEFPSISEHLVKQEALTDLAKSEWKAIEDETRPVVKELTGHINQYSPSLFEKASDFLLGLTAQYALLRIHLLKFLAILPSLDHDKTGTEVKRILLEALKRFLKDNKKSFYLKKKGQERALPKSYAFSLMLSYYVAKIMPARPLAATVRTLVRFMAKRFIAGETIETADESLRSLYSTNRDATLDQLGELVVSEGEADHYCREVIKLIKGFSLHVKKGELNKAGIHRAHVSIKVSALCSDFKPEAFDYTYGLVSPRLKQILMTAKNEDVFINIDAEHYHYRDIVFKVYRKVLLETPELKDYSATGIVLQAYLRDGAKHLREIIELAKERNLVMPVRIVKGAYWDAETVEGDAHAFNAPQFLNKEETDLHFRQLIIEIFKAHPHLKLCLASHNFSDHAWARVVMNKKFPQVGEFEHQCLHMTYEALSHALAKMNWPVRNYVPVGSLLVGMAYLVRRIMENSSQVGVLTIMRSHKKQESLLSPLAIHYDKVKNRKLARDLSQVKLSDEFFNITPLRIYLDQERKWMESALNLFVKNDLGKNYENNFKTHGAQKEIISSSAPETVVGKISWSTIEDAQAALKTVTMSHLEGHWRQTPVAVRASTLIRAANLMLTERTKLSALIMYEAGKALNEALGDVDEAIDFLNYYAREATLFEEKNSDVEVRGPFVVISPWNFPLAIPCGMVSAALVAGNPVVLKSAEQTPLIAQALTDLLHRAGVPKDVLIHLPGDGETVGDALVRDERVAGIVFTGSKFVGQLIAHHAGQRLYRDPVTGRSSLVKVITEMGGKNAIIVTANAELDETVSGILYSAFGHAGQKCSACSRVIVDERVKDRLIERLKSASLDMKVGPGFDFSTKINPLITKEDADRVKRQVLEATAEANSVKGRVVVDRSQSEKVGFCVGPVVIEVPYQEAMKHTSFAQRELFAPVVHVVGFKTLDQALELFNATEYALTGGIFSQSQNDIDYLVSKMEAGNIYVNRSITGARVAIEPFGGFKMSGTGPKAGGEFYLPSFYRTKMHVEVKALPALGGSDYQVIPSRKSLLTVSSRVERMQRALDVLLNRFETFFYGVWAQEKQALKDYRIWVDKNAKTFFEEQRSNRKIPGQLSYTEFNLKNEQALLVAAAERPSIYTVLSFLSGVLTGTGMTVVCVNRESYDWWNKLIVLLYQSGHSKENIDVYHVSLEQLKATYNNPMFSVVIFDHAGDELKEQLKLLFNKAHSEKRMRHIQAPIDLPHLRSVEFFVLPFVQVRSFAVNTMRHGAPLDFEVK